MSSNFKKKRITILGATGSIGQSTADVICASPELFEVHAVTANKNAAGLAAIAQKLNAKKAIIADTTHKAALEELLKDTSIEVLAGQDAINSCAAEPVDLVVAAIVGFIGLKPIIRALEQGIDVAIANKEPLVAAGEMIMSLAQENGAKILPVDSEHNAIFQVFETDNKPQIDKLILTASGGPFLNWKADDMKNATPEQAIAHPNWSMGAKISVDSATMVNKALEIIEAAYLFDMPAEQIDVAIHPQSVVHSIVSYKDGSMLAQMGKSDMRTPIASALAWPDRLDKGGDILDIHALSNLSFEKPDLDKFPAIKYAYKCLALGQAACIAFNAANEVTVEAFLNNKISFGDIMKCISNALDVIHPDLPKTSLKTVEEIEKLDNIVRDATNDFISSNCKV